MKFRILIDREKDEEIVARVHERTPLIDEIEELVSRWERTGEIVGYIGEDIVMLDLGDVEAFYIESGRTYAACADGNKYRIRMPLYELEAILPGSFRRINKSAIANMKRIVRYRSGLNGAVDAVFGSGFSDYISRRCFAELKKEYSL
ncbi:MAG: LytTR family transcriptional regulator [Ruminococcaceae bacterium]|nr:LytTR family transcriptional regulator [Oscillospiraceae bacterium]